MAGKNSWDVDLWGAIGQPAPEQKPILPKQSAAKKPTWDVDLSTALSAPVAVKPLTAKKQEIAQLQAELEAQGKPPGAVEPKPLVKKAGPLDLLSGLAQAGTFAYKELKPKIEEARAKAQPQAGPKAPILPAGQRIEAVGKPRPSGILGTMTDISSGIQGFLLPNVPKSWDELKKMSIGQIGRAVTDLMSTPFLPARPVIEMGHKLREGAIGAVKGEIEIRKEIGKRKQTADAAADKLEAAVKTGDKAAIEKTRQEFHSAIQAIEEIKPPDWGKYLAGEFAQGAEDVVQGQINTARMLLRGLDFLASGIVPAEGYDVTKEFGPGRFLTKELEKSEAISQEIEKKQKGVTPIQEFIGSGVRGATGMVPQMAWGVWGPGAATKGASFLQRAGERAVRMLPFIIKSFGGYSREAEQEGATPGQQALYAGLATIAEVATEAPIMDKLTDLLKGAGGISLAQAGWKNFLASYGQRGVEWLGNAAKEGFQEAGVDPLTGLAKKLVYKHDMPWAGKGGVWDWGQMTKDFQGGVSMGLIMFGLGMVGSKSEAKAKKIVGKPLDAQTVSNLMEQIGKDATEIAASKITPVKIDTGGIYDNLRRRLRAGEIDHKQFEMEMARAVKGKGLQAEAGKINTLASQQLENFNTTLQEIVDDLNLVGFKSRVKSVNSLINKVIRKNMSGDTQYDLHSITDHLGGALLLHDMKDAPRIIEALKAKIPNLTGKITTNDTGYQGIHLSMDMGDGLRGEIQIHTSESWAIKVKTDHIYEKWRDVEKTDVTEDVLKEWQADRVKSEKLWREFWDKQDQGIMDAASSSVKALVPSSMIEPSLPSKGTQAPPSQTIGYPPPGGMVSTMRPAASITNLEGILTTPFDSNIPQETTGGKETGKPVPVPEAGPVGVPLKRDVTRRLLDEIRHVSDFGNVNVRTWTKKAKGTLLTATEKAVMAQIPSEGLSLGFVSNALVYATPIRQMPKPQRAALLSLLDRGELSVSEVDSNGQKDYQITKTQALKPTPKPLAKKPLKPLEKKTEVKKRLTRAAGYDLAFTQVKDKLRQILEKANGQPVYIVPQMRIVVDGKEHLINTGNLLRVDSNWGGLGATHVGANMWQLPREAKAPAPLPPKGEVVGAVERQIAPAPPSLKKAASHAKEAAKEAYAALDELFGGGRLGITPQEFSPDSYQRARPHLERAWAEFKAVGGEFKDFIIHMVQEFGEGVRAYLVQFRDEVEKKRPEISRFRTDTIERATMFTDEDRRHLTKEEFEYLPEKNVEQREQAIKNIEADMEAVMRRHEKIPEIGGGVEAFEAAAINQQLVKEARETGDYSRLKRWSRITSEKARDWGRGLQATGAAHEKMGSPAAVVHKAQRVVDQVHEEAKKRNPVQAKKIDEETKEIKKELDAIQRGEGDAEAKRQKALEALRKRLLVLKKTRERQAQFERIMKFIEMGAYEDAEIRDLLHEKYGLPILTNEDVQLIVEQMALTERLEEGSYEKKAAIARVQKIIADKVPPSMRDKFRGLLRITLLANPKTHVRNIMGNITMGIEALRENTIAPIIDTAISLVTGKRSTVFAPLAKGKAFMIGATKGISEWTKDIRYGVDTAASRGQAEMPRGRTFKSPILNFLERGVGGLLQAGDRPFYEGWRQSRLAELQKIHKTTEITEDMMIAAHLYALDKVYQNNSVMARSAKDLKRALGWLGEISIPFTQTPANILDKLVDYSPAGLAKGIYHLSQTAGKGTFDQKLFTDRISRALTGTGIMMLGYALAKAGIITGRPPEDKDAREFLRAAGVSPYAIRIGNHYYTYDWMQPVGGMLAAGADFYLSGKDKKSFLEKAAKGAVGAVNTVLNQSFLQGLIRLVGGGYGEGPAEGAAKTVMESPLMFLPTLSRQAAQLVDPYVRRAETIPQKAISRIPFVSKTLPPKISAMGEPVEAYQGRRDILSVMFSPGFYTKRKDDPVTKMVIGLYERTGETKHFPRIVSDKLTFGDVTIKLTVEQQNELQRIQGKMTRARFSLLAPSKITDEQKIDKLQGILTDVAKAAKQKFLWEQKEEILKGLMPKERLAVLKYLYR